MNEIGFDIWLREAMGDEFILTHICVVALGALISSSGFILLSL